MEVCLHCCALPVCTQTLIDGDQCFPLSWLPDKVSAATSGQAAALLNNQRGEAQMSVVFVFFFTWKPDESVPARLQPDVSESAESSSSIKPGMTLVVRVRHLHLESLGSLTLSSWNLSGCFANVIFNPRFSASCWDFGGFIFRLTLVICSASQWTKSIPCWHCGYCPGRRSWTYCYLPKGLFPEVSVSKPFVISGLVLSLFMALKKKHIMEGRHATKVFSSPRMQHMCG